MVGDVAIGARLGSAQKGILEMLVATWDVKGHLC